MFLFSVVLGVLTRPIKQEKETKDMQIGKEDYSDGIIKYKEKVENPKGKTILIRNFWFQNQRDISSIDYQIYIKLG